MDTNQKLAQFENRVQQAATNIFPHIVLSVTAKGRYRLTIRVELSAKTFIDIFYNPKNDRTDFALIHENQRIFGYDNLGGWHRHSVEDPQTHTPCDEPLFDQVFQEMKAIFDSSPEDSNNDS